jgi:arginase
MLPETELRSTPSGDAPADVPIPTRAVHFIAVRSDLGAPLPGARDGPDELLRAIAFNATQHEHVDPPGGPGAGSRLQGRDTMALAHLTRHLASAVTACLPHQVPFVLSGDHSSAIGTWQGVTRAMHRSTGGRTGPGLVWIDAHMDAHTPQGSPSGALHGMPLAVLLGEGDPRLVDKGALLDPARIALVGVRSFEPPEARRLERLGVAVYTMADIRREGLPCVLAGAIRRASASDGAAPSPWGLSLDLDAIDPTEAPAVNTPAPGGLGTIELVDTLTSLSLPSLPIALELTEYNPARDTDGRTRRVAAALLGCLLDRLEQGHLPR